MAKTIPGKRGGTLTPWQKGQSGNPKGHQKGLLHWVKQLASKKSFMIEVTMEDEKGVITTVSKTLSLKESAAQVAAAQLWIKAISGDMEALRELSRIEQAAKTLEASQKPEEDKKADQSISIPFTIIDSGVQVDIPIGAAIDDATDQKTT